MEGEITRRCEVEVVPPARRRWRVDTALPAVAGAGSGRRWRFRAVDYDELVDSPFEAGTHAVRRFRAGRATFELALYGRPHAHVRRLLDLLRRGVTPTRRM